MILRQVSLSGVFAMKMNKLKKITASLLGCAAVFSAAPLMQENAVNTGAAETYVSQCKEMLDLVNKYRADNGAAPLKLYIPACNAATARAAEIKTVFSHDRPDGSSCFTVLDEYNVKYSSAGENIAYGYPNVESVVSAWMNSDGHRSNILNSSYKYLGIGIDGYHWSQFFIGGAYCNAAFGDVNGDGAINSIDASEVLQYYAYQSTAPWFEHLSAFIKASDVNKDNATDALDASGILHYYAASATGGTPSFN